MVTVEKVRITSEFDMDDDMEKLIDVYETVMSERLDKVVGYVDVDLEGKRKELRSKECKIGNWIADIIQTEYDNVDISLINSGTIRGNFRNDQGEITARMIGNLFPMTDNLVILKLPGWLIMSMLENSVSQLPKLDGRFAHFSGVKFWFDIEKPVGSRVFNVRDANDNPFDFDRDYNIVTKSYIGSGRDGYECFKYPAVEVVKDEEYTDFIENIILEQLRSFDTSSP